MKMTNDDKQKNLVNRALVITCLSAVLGLTGCQKEGTAEKAGKEIDSVTEKVGQNIEQAAEKAETKIEAAKESMGKETDKAVESINESTDASKGALEKAGQKLDQATEKAESKIEGAKESIIDKAETAGEYIDDSVITTKVKAAILNDPLLNASHIDVTTVKGVVKLSGTVDSEQSIGRAVEVVKSQMNVKSVQTDLIVKSAQGK